MENRTGQILELENGQQFLILRQAMYKDKLYYVVDTVVASPDGDEEKSTLAKQFSIIEEVEQDGKIFYKTIEDAEIALKILEK